MKRAPLILSAILIYAAVTVTACAPASCPEIGKEAPNFTLKTIHGDSLSLNDFQGKTVLINFWAMNCNPCLIEMPLIQLACEKWSDQSLVVLAINIRDSAPATSKFIAAKGFTFAVLIDIGAEVFHSYCLPEVVPVTLLISAEGNLMAKKAGNFRSLEEIESFLAPCMPTKAAQ